MAIAESEAVNNAINQGKDDPDQIVSVDVIHLPKVMLYVFIRDSAGKLNIEDINLGISDTFETDESGRGFFIMTHYCSVVAYCCDDKSEISSNQKEIILGLEPENGE